MKLKIIYDSLGYLFIFGKVKAIGEIIPSATLIKFAQEFCMMFNLLR